jgi:hypothetical protein
VEVVGLGVPPSQAAGERGTDGGLATAGDPGHHDDGLTLWHLVKLANGTQQVHGYTHSKLSASTATMMSMGSRRAGAAGAFAAAMAATVVLLSAPSAARASTVRLFGDRHAVVDVATPHGHLSAVSRFWPRRPALSEYVGPAGAVVLSLVLLALAVAVTPRAVPVVRRSRPAVRGPPYRAS